MASILLMEDDAAQADLLSLILSGAGHQVLHSGGGQEALDRLASETVDIVITDILVKRHDRNVADGGLTLVGSIRTQEMGIRGTRVGRMPIIAISGGFAIDTGPDTLQLAESMGADVCLAKPVDPEGLLAEVDRLLGLPSAPVPQDETLRP